MTVRIGINGCGEVPTKAHLLAYPSLLTASSLCPAQPSYF